MTEIHHVKSFSELREVCQWIMNHSSSKVFELYGELGAGKTSLVCECCILLGVDQNLPSSPTYSIHNVYYTNKFLVHHFDLYRIHTLREFLDLGVEEMIDDKSYVFIEWPKFSDHLKTKKTKIFIESDGNSRTLKIDYDREDFESIF